jgi:D-proline reductase (dithiol) PrdB
MPVDSFKWLPRSIAGYYQAMQMPDLGEIPWTPMTKPIAEARFALVTTAGVYVKHKQEPFDLEGERKNPLWGDPTYRAIPSDVSQNQVGVAHLHINTEDIEDDVNIVLPVQRFQELAETGEVGSLASHHYSFMGYQANDDEWRNRYGSEVAQRMIEAEVDAALITPA